MKALLLSLLIIIILFSGCISQNSAERERAISVCIDACKNYQGNLSNGPCLLNPIQPEKDFPSLSKWVCDVAHSPRQNVDNLPENQCSAYREGIANHFVEVDTNCGFIKAM
jgi:hypothetical protein